MLEKQLISSLISKPENYFYAVDRISQYETKEARDIVACVGNLLAAGKDVTETAIMIQFPEYINWIGECSDFIACGPIGKEISDKIEERNRAERIKKALSEILNTTLRIFDSQEAMADIYRLYQQETKKSDTKDIKDAIEEYRQGKGKYGINTEYITLENNYLSFVQGHLWVLGGWTSVGKTSVMIDMVVRLYQRGNPGTIVFSVEMSRSQIIARIIARLTGISSQMILDDNLQETSIPKVQQAENWLSEKNITIFDNIRDIEKIIVQCRKKNMSEGLDVFFVDYIQKVKKKGFRSKYEMISEISGDFQDLAKDTKSTCVCLSQISNTASKENSQLEYKNAGEIAADCDVGIRLARSKEDDSVLLWLTEKNRHGAKPNFALQFVDNWTRLKEIPT